MKFHDRTISSVCTLCFTLLVLTLSPVAVFAGQVELVLEASKAAPITAMQDWGRELNAAKVHKVRIRQQTSLTTPTIETRAVGGQKFYTVRGTIDRDGHVNVPGERFQAGEAKRLARWLDEVAEKGPPSEREPVDKFGLTLSTMKKVGVDLATPITFETSGSSLAAIVRRVNKETRFPILATKKMMATLEKEKVSTELKGFPVGTALTYLVEPFGLGLYPGEGKKGKVQYLVVKRSAKKVEPWPIGWKPKQRMETVPGLFVKKNINIDRIPVDQVLKEISKRVEVPFLVDQTALASQKIDMTKTIVSFPNKKTNFDRALATMLWKAKLKYQLLLDDAGRPFLWVTPLADK